MPREGFRSEGVKVRHPGPAAQSHRNRPKCISNILILKPQETLNSGGVRVLGPFRECGPVKRDPLGTPVFPFEVQNGVLILEDLNFRALSQRVSNH